AEPVRSSPLGRRSAPTSAARLAAATGARVSYDDEAEAETVAFPRPAGASFAPAVALMRAADDDSQANAGQGGDQAAAPAPAAAPQAPPRPAQQPGGGGGGGGGDIDELYDQVMQRLRRDLLADRERMGDLLGDLP